MCCTTQASHAVAFRAHGPSSLLQPKCTVACNNSVLPLATCMAAKGGKRAARQHVEAQHKHKPSVQSGNQFTAGRKRNKTAQLAPQHSTTTALHSVSEYSHSTGTQVGVPASTAMHAVTSTPTAAEPKVLPCAQPGCARCAHAACKSLAHPCASARTHTARHTQWLCIPCWADC